MAAAPTVTYVDLGFTSARQFLDEMVLPAYDRFRADNSRQAAMNTAILAWHLVDWLWHDRHPGVDTRGPRFSAFRGGLIAICPELALVRDIADASRHRGLGRVPQVATMKSEPNWVVAGGQPVTFAGQPVHAGYSLELTVTPGGPQDVAVLLSKVISFWTTEIP
jgi:hypothetical protein